MQFKTLLVLAASGLCSPTWAQAPAFPGAEGNGRYTTGGRGGKIVHVTNLNDKGAGSLRAAVSGNGKKMVVFDMGGVIALASDLKIGANTTILGQTAPYPGITLRYYTVEPGSNNIIRFIRVRRGQEKNVNDGADAIWNRHLTGVMLDHCSFSWSIDEVASFYDNNNFTMQWCTVGESLNNAGHGKGAHGYGGIWGGKLASFHHNMIAHVNNRAPRFNGARYNWTGYTANAEYAKHGWQNAVQAENVDFRNCLVFDWGGGGCYGGPGGGYINMVNNYYKATPETSAKDRVTQVSVANSTTSSDDKTYLDMTSRYFISGNYVHGYGADYDWRGVKYDSGVQTIGGQPYTRDSLYAYGRDVAHVRNAAGVPCVSIKLDTPHAPTGEVTTHSAEQAYAKILAFGGASLFRDDVDHRYMTEARSGTSTYTGSKTRVKGRVDVVADVDGYTEKNFPKGSRPAGFDTDGDGMPDAWETANRLNPNDPADASASTLDAKGYYTNLEVYANALVEDIVRGGNADAQTAVDEYFPGCQKASGMDYYTGRLVERVTEQDTTKTDTTDNVHEMAIYSTTFTDWTDAKATATESTVAKTTRYSHEPLSFTLYDTQVSSTNQNPAKFPNWAGGYLMCSKSKDPYVATSPLASITKVHFIHGATGSNRGWKLEAKGDGDADWVTLSEAVATKPAGTEVTVEVNRTNCRLRFTNLNGTQNAYLFQLDIYGKVHMGDTPMPQYTLTYYDTDGTTVLGTQRVEQDAAIGSFAYGSADATVAEGCVFRGWFKAARGSGNRKYTVADAVTADMALYAVATEREGQSTTRRYVFDLTDRYFYDEDHEAFQLVGAGRFHDSNHGWQMARGDSLHLLVGGNAYIMARLCQYGSAANVRLLDGQDRLLTTISTPAAKDGAVASYYYQGPAGRLTLVFDGAPYVHAITVANVQEAAVAKNAAGYYMVKAGDADNLLTTLDVANATAGEARTYIFLPRGRYDLGEKTLTPIAGDNISIIGEDRNGTVVVNAPKVENEGIGRTATFLITGRNAYLQDLTLQNALDYYASGNAGRAVVIQDKGHRTICKNVRLLSYQDTYYSNADGQYYFEDGEIHGTVDFICGSGDVFFRRVTLVSESRSAGSKTGSNVIAAPYPGGSVAHGYVFDSCTVVNRAKELSLGRSWGGQSRLAWLNTTLIQPAEIVATRFTARGMNTPAYSFKEYASVDSKGTVVTPASNVVTFTKGDDSRTYDTTLAADETEQYALAAVFPDWNPQALAAQAATTGLVRSANRLTWNAAEGAPGYAVFADGVFQGITTTPSFEAPSGATRCTVRTANAMGGFGPAQSVGGATAVQSAAAGAIARYYSPSGVQLAQPRRGLNLRVSTLPDGRQLTEKVMVR